MPGWIWSALAFAVFVGAFMLARHKASRPADLLKPRLVDYVLVQLLFLVAAVVAFGFTLYLISGSQPHMRPW
jgi:hypothetical protein